MVRCPKGKKKKKKNVQGEKYGRWMEEWYFKEGLHRGPYGEVDTRQKEVSGLVCEQDHVNRGKSLQ